MPLPDEISAENDKAGVQHEVVASCDLLWSLAQQFSYLRLSDQRKDGTYVLIGLYAARARRISATYARFYLETEQGGDPSKLGRYYWMALGAFASKTVACLLDSFQLQSSYALGFFSPMDMDEIANGLAQGNLWLFSDIAPPHWFYNHYPENFFSGMACIEKRSANTLEKPVKDRVNALPWSAKSLSKIHYFAASSDLKEGFKFTQKIENTSAAKDRQKLQLDQLMAIANHEQLAVLQELIYKDPVFTKWLDRERKYFRWLAPTYQLVFSHDCSIDDPDLKSVAPDDTIVEDFQSRMKWITNAANKFHNLMQVKTSYMHSEIRTMSGWVASSDAFLVY